MRAAAALGAMSIIFALGTDARSDHIRISSDGTITNITETSSLKVISRPEKKIDKSEYDELIKDCASKHGLQPSLIKAVIEAESNYDPLAVSRKGAMGLMQLMPETAEMLGVDSPFDPRQNIEGGTRYLAELLGAFGGRLHLALAAYNAGPTVVGSMGRIPQNRETPNYVDKVLKVYVSEGGVLPEPEEEKKRDTPTPEKPRKMVFLCRDEQGRTVITNVPILRSR